MTVLTTVMVTLKPGRFEDYLENMAKPAKPIVEGIGLRNYRVFAGFYAGEATGQVVVVNEADDFAAAGAATDKALADPRIVAMMRSSDDGPVASQQMQQWIEIPL
jgi:hypothetical protein